MRSAGRVEQPLWPPLKERVEIERAFRGEIPCRRAAHALPASL